MAAYASTTVIEGVMGAVGQGKLAWGTINVTNYNATGVEITAITGLFNGRAPKKIILEGVSDSGHLGQWNGTEIVCWDHLDTGVGELANDTDAGLFNFIAFG